MDVRKKVRKIQRRSRKPGSTDIFLVNPPKAHTAHNYEQCEHISRPAKMLAWLKHGFEKSHVGIIGIGLHKLGEAPKYQTRA